MTRIGGGRGRGREGDNKKNQEKRGVGGEKKMRGERGEDEGRGYSRERGINYL